MAVAHALLVIADYLPKRKEAYRELGPDHFDNMNADRVRRSLVRRLERLGNRVTLEPLTHWHRAYFRRSESRSSGPQGGVKWPKIAVR